MIDSTVAEIMTKDVVVATLDQSFKEIARTLYEKDISGLPVVDDKGCVVGIVTEADLLRAEDSEGEVARRHSFLDAIFGSGDEMPHANLMASDLMSSPVVTVTTTTSIRHAVRVIVEAAVKRLPVVDDAGWLVGIVGRHDLLRPFTRSDEAIHDEIRDDLIRDAMWLQPEPDVTVEGGVVVLGGQVESRSSKEILLQLARRVDGVVGVEDHLTFIRDDRGSQSTSPAPRSSPTPGRFSGRAGV